MHTARTDPKQIAAHALPVEREDRMQTSKVGPRHAHLIPMCTLPYCIPETARAPEAKPTSETRALSRPARHFSDKSHTDPSIHPKPTARLTNMTLPSITKSHRLLQNSIHESHAPCHLLSIRRVLGRYLSPSQSLSKIQIVDDEAGPTHARTHTHTGGFSTQELDQRPAGSITHCG
jgi:hypothetical protein